MHAMHMYLSCSAWGLQYLVKSVQDVQYQNPGWAQDMMQPVCYVEQGPQGMHILGSQNNAC